MQRLRHYSNLLVFSSFRYSIFSIKCRNIQLRRRHKRPIISHLTARLARYEMNFGTDKMSICNKFFERNVHWLTLVPYPLLCEAHIVLDASFDLGNQMVIYGACPHHGSQSGMLVASVDSILDVVFDGLSYNLLAIRRYVNFLALVYFSLFLFPSSL